METEFDHETHIARSLLYAAWACVIFFFVDLTLLGLWIAGSFLPVPQNWLSLAISIMEILSALLVASATLNLLARIIVALTTRIRIPPFSWLFWPFCLIFGASCLFLASLIGAFSSGLG